MSHLSSALCGTSTPSHRNQVANGSSAASSAFAECNSSSLQRAWDSLRADQSQLSQLDLSSCESDEMEWESNAPNSSAADAAKGLLSKALELLKKEIQQNRERKAWTEQLEALMQRYPPL